MRLEQKLPFPGQTIHPTMQPHLSIRHSSCARWPSVPRFLDHFLFGAARSALGRLLCRFTGRLPSSRSGTGPICPSSIDLETATLYVPDRSEEPKSPEPSPAVHDHLPVWQPCLTRRSTAWSVSRLSGPEAYLDNPSARIGNKGAASTWNRRPKSLSSRCMGWLRQTRHSS